MRAQEFITELRDQMYQYIRSIVPTWPEYVVRDWLYKGRGRNKNYNVNSDVKGEILEMIADSGLSLNTNPWQLVPNVKFTMDMFGPVTKKNLIGRAGGTSDLGMGIPKDKERHATQAALIQQGGVSREPVILIKRPQGYDLIEGWHRTIQHFARYPDGYVGPAYVAVAQSKPGITESMAADQVLDYVKSTHAPDEFDIEYSITDHPEWELKTIPLSQLNLDPDGEESDPYNRVNWVDDDKVQELIPQIEAVLKRMPIVVDPAGWIIDGNHRAVAAAEAGLTIVPALVPVEPDVTEGKIKLYTDPGYFGAEVDDAGFDSLPIVNISADRLVGFEPDSKMNQPKSQANVKKIVAGLKKGDKLPPLLVRKYKKGYQVLDGHHRFWAYKLLGTKSIPAQVVPDSDIEEISKQGVAEDMRHSRDGRAVEELKAALLAKRDQLQSATDDQVYDIIDKIMTRIARSHSISGQKLHDMWVDKYKQIPDTWVMNEDTEQKPVIIYTDHRGATIDDGIKNSLRVTQIPVDKLRLWEKHKSMQDPKVADWVTNKLLPELKQNGKLKPLLVWNNNGQFFVIDGNHRLIAYQEAGYKGNVPVQIVPDNMITVSDTVPGQQGVAENFADGKGPGRPGDSQRHGIPKGATMAELEKASHAKGRKGQLARWQLNMRRGRKK